ncbi:hypothetical protein HJD18_13635 [Thermoleophilia bacterium SCSIO 60948]|nr:hypothetical protein HJD18_13635 [Thermoleophilia bacterium SCSIO 60948]
MLSVIRVEGRKQVLVVLSVLGGIAAFLIGAITDRTVLALAGLAASSIISFLFELAWVQSFDGRTSHLRAVARVSYLSGVAALLVGALLVPGVIDLGQGSLAYGVLLAACGVGFLINGRSVRRDIWNAEGLEGERGHP